MKETFPNAVICLSNGLNAPAIKSLKQQGAVIGSIGCGDNIASPDKRVGAVYKICATEEDGKLIPKIKVSEDKIKTTNPGLKKVWRFYDKDTGYALGDIIAKHNETIPLDGYTFVNHEDTLQTKDVTNYTVRELQVPIFKNGHLVYQDPTIEEKRAYCNREMNALYPEVKRVEKPHKYIVDLSNELRELRDQLIRAVNAETKAKQKTLGSK
jgi:nicotinate phosphoribosyltransferase